MLPDGRAAYDGRATKDENWFERTGLAGPGGGPGRLAQTNDAPASHVRYLDVLPLPDGGYRIWYEAPLPGESHELRWGHEAAYFADPDGNIVAVAQPAT